MVLASKNPSAAMFHMADAPGRLDHLLLEVSTHKHTVLGAISGIESCRQVRCRFRVPDSTAITLTKMPTQPHRHPFDHWLVNSYEKIDGATVTFTARKKVVTVTAVYR
jgi:hypothetical protein